MKLYAFNVGTELVDIANFDPMGPEVGTKVRTPYFFYVVAHERGPVVFDTGAAPRFMDVFDPDAPGDYDGPKIIMRPGDDLQSKLASIGVAPEDVEHVVLSHLHLDHAGGVGLFPNATFHVQAAELAFARDPPVYQRGFYFPEDWDLPVDWNELDGETDLFGDGSLILFETPGHSKGHQSLLVELDGTPVILVADAAYSPRNLDERKLPAILWNPDAMVESWERIEDWRDRHGAKLLYTHDLTWQDSVRLAPDAWYE